MRENRAQPVIVATNIATLLTYKKNSPGPTSSHKHCNVIDTASTLPFFLSSLVRRPPDLSLLYLSHFLIASSVDVVVAEDQDFRAVPENTKYKPYEVLFENMIFAFGIISIVNYC